MSSAGSNAPSFHAAARILARVRSKGVRMWVADGALRYKAPKGVLSVDEIEGLRGCTKQLIELLKAAEDASGSTELKLEPRGPADRIPLTYSQLKYWHSDQLAHRPSVRTVTAAFRLRGALDSEALHQSILTVVARHEALRTRIAVRDGLPEQEVESSYAPEMPILDLTAASSLAREQDVQRAIEELILRPVHVAAGPLFVAELLRLDTDEHVLVIAIEHMVADAFSLGIMRRELPILYAGFVSRVSVALPPVPIQLGDYALWQSKSRESWLKRHGQYWAEHLAGCGKLPFRGDLGAHGRATSVLANIPLLVDTEMRSALYSWCRLRRSTMAMTVFSVFAALVLRWCEASRTVVQYQTDGRFNAMLDHTVGYIASVLNLRIELRASDTFQDMLERVTTEYCDAREHADSSYLEAQRPALPFIRNARFNWVPHPPSKAMSDEVDSVPLEWSSVPFEYPPLTDCEADCAPMVMLFDRGDEIAGSVWFPLGRYTEHTMSAFANNFLCLLRALIQDPFQPVAAVPLELP